MSTFDIRQDAPGILRTESLQVSINFTRTSDTTARISWNIPIPAAGCAAGTQAYCGIVVTVDTRPVTASTTPTHGASYLGDPTTSLQLHAGDRIGTALVVGAFYQDRDTTFFDVSGLEAGKTYYVSGFPCDCQLQYFQEGVHAYSKDLTVQGSNDTSGTQVVILNEGSSPSGVLGTDSTGLDLQSVYDVTLHLGLVPKPNRPLLPQECELVPPKYTLTLSGADGQTYDDLVATLNTQIALLETPTQGTTPPQANTYVVKNQKLYRWTGFTHEEVTGVVWQGTDPSTSVDGTYWYNPSTAVLKIRTAGAWVTQPYITYSYDPADPQCDITLWVNGSLAYRWNGTTWIAQTVYNQTTDPSLVFTECGSYWYNTQTEYLYKWLDTTHQWASVDAIQFATDPTLVPNGTYWYNETANTLMLRTLGAWAATTGVQYSATAPSVPVANMVWFNNSTLELNIRNGANTAWVDTPFLSYPTDPTQPASGELWWEQVDMDTVVLHMWNVAASQWETVTSFMQAAADPYATPVMTQGTVWINNGVVMEWDNSCFVPVEAVVSATDPRNVADGVVWYNPTTGTFGIRDTGAWDPLTVTSTTQDPATLALNTFWYNTSLDTLQSWNGLAWVLVAFSTTDVVIATGALWLNTASGVIYEWSGTEWVLHTPLATVSMNCFNNIEFKHNKQGSLSFMRIEDGNLFSSLSATVRYDSPVPGQDGVSDIPSYAEPGIGTDLSSDERNKLANEIRYALGYPVVDVEAAPEQIDLAITIALSELRARTSVAYKHGYFFMRTESENQRYLLTNKVAGMNKIVSVLSVQRLMSSFLSSAHGAGVYGQIVLQHLYNMGNFDILSYHLMAEYIKTLEIMFAGRLTFNWDEHKRELFIHNRFPFAERMVLIEAMVERTEQDLLTDRWCKEWLRRYATAKVKEMLASVRGKFSTLPGAGGSVTLNASDLKMQAEAEIAACLQEIDDFVVDRPEEVGYTSAFVFG